MPRELYTALEREVLNEKSENDEGLAALLADDGMECDDSEEEDEMDDAALMLLYDAQRYIVCLLDGKLYDRAKPVDKGKKGRMSVTHLFKHFSKELTKETLKTQI